MPRTYWMMPTVRYFSASATQQRHHNLTTYGLHPVARIHVRTPVLPLPHQTVLDTWVEIMRRSWATRLRSVADSSTKELLLRCWDCLY
jgi:hypothetical protein